MPKCHAILPRTFPRRFPQRRRINRQIECDVIHAAKLVAAIMTLIIMRYFDEKP